VTERVAVGDELGVCDCDGVGEQSALSATSHAPRYGRACAHDAPLSAEAHEPRVAAVPVAGTKSVAGLDTLCQLTAAEAERTSA